MRDEIAYTFMSCNVLVMTDEKYVVSVAVNKVLKKINKAVLYIICPCAKEYKINIKRQYVFVEKS